MFFSHGKHRSLHAKIKCAFDIVAYRRVYKTKTFKEKIRELPKRLKYYVQYHFLPVYFGQPPKWRMWARRTAGRRRTAPDFAVIGPIKSGSSDFSAMLMCHPNIVPPLAKEVGPFMPRSAMATYYPTLAQMQDISRTLGCSRTGYFSPYLSIPGMAEYLKNVIGVEKIVIPLRDPVKRAYSHWKWEVFFGKMQRRNPGDFFNDFEDYVERLIKLFPYSPRTYCGFPALLSGIYAPAVEEYYEYFGRASVLIVNMDEYFHDRSRCLASAAAFLGLPAFQWVGDFAPINENPIKLKAAQPETNEKLARFYDPYNQALYRIIGQRFPWTKPAEARKELSANETSVSNPAGGAIEGGVQP
jgi:hypothetical protein